MEGGEATVRAEVGRRPRLTLLEQMSGVAADSREHSSVTLDEILNLQKRSIAGTPPPEPETETPKTPGRTLLDVIRDEDPKASSFKGFGARDKKTWRSFKDRLRLRRSGSGAAWTSSVRVPTSDIIIPTSRSFAARRNSVRSLFTESPLPSVSPRRRSLEATTSHLGGNESESEGNSTGATSRPQISRRTSCRFGAFSSFSDHSDDGHDGGAESSSPRRRGGLRPQISRLHSTRFSPAMDDSGSDATEPPQSQSAQPKSEASRRLSAVLAEERSLSAREAVAAQEAAEAASASAAELEAAEAEVSAPAPARMSLMELLEETDRQMGLVGSRYLIGDEDEEEEEEDEFKENFGAEEEISGAGVGVGAAEQSCCVCMLRHKGAAFIPCGHTFCRLCSRELWVSRGNCPLCNGFILEILDIF